MEGSAQGRESGLRVVILNGNASFQFPICFVATPETARQGIYSLLVQGPDGFQIRYSFLRFGTVSHTTVCIRIV